MSELSTTTAAPPVFRLGDSGRAVAEIRARLDLLGLTGAVASSDTSTEPTREPSTVPRPGRPDVFDDAATGQGLLNYFLRALNCGAITLDDVAQTGLTQEEFALRSFAKILSARRDRLQNG